MPEGKSEKEHFGPEIVRLDGKVAIITGGTTGIGRATALLLARYGVKVVIYGRKEDPLEDALNDLKETGGQYHGLTADQAYEDDIKRVFSETKEHFGDIDILVNNAAVSAGSALEMSYDEALYTLRANILGYMTCTREAVAMMRRKGGGHIVNVGSLSAVEREAGSDVYVATKSAIQGMSESYRKQLAQEKIRVSLIEPGQVGTNLSTEEPDVEQQVERQAEGRQLEAEDLARAVYYILTQPERSNILELHIAPAQQGL